MHTLSKKKNKKVNAIVRACYSVEARKMRDLLMPEGVTEWGDQWIPWPDHTQENAIALEIPGRADINVKSQRERGADLHAVPGVLVHHSTHHDQ